MVAGTQEFCVVRTEYKSGEDLWSNLSKLTRQALTPDSPEPIDAEEPVWVPLFSLHGSQPQIDLKDGKLPTVGVTRREAYQAIVQFEVESGSFGGCGHVLRVSELQGAITERFKISKWHQG